MVGGREVDRWWVGGWVGGWVVRGRGSGWVVGGGKGGRWGWMRG